MFNAKFLLDALIGAGSQAGQKGGMAGGIGGFIALPFMHYLIEWTGWQQSLLWL